MVFWNAGAVVMLMTIEVQGKKVILLNGVGGRKGVVEPKDIPAIEQLRHAARKDPDAVAFGYMSGRWVAAA